MTIGQASWGVLLSKLASKEVIDFLYNWNVDKLLISKVETMLLITLDELEHAELKQFKHKNLRRLLHMVNVAIYDAEDLLDEIATDALESVNKQRGLIKDCVGISDSVITAIDSKGREVTSALHPLKETIETRMKDLIENLEFLIKGMGHLGSKIIEKKVDYGTGTVSAEIYGRDLDKMEILKLLKAGEKDKQVGVVPIVGMGGVGKTTLAKMVYNSNDLQYDLKVWTDVTNIFDDIGITKAIIESTGSVCNFTHLNLVQGKLNKKLQGKKFLLVLDDMGNEDYNLWKVLMISFSVGKPGSQIIVTTRNRNIGTMIGTVPFYNLAKLSTDDCWSLMEGIAFPNRDSAAFPVLTDIGKAISMKCDGLPLAAITLGGLLRSKTKDEKQWNFILKSELWDLPVDYNILPSLLVSYGYLPTEVKKCFVYCAVFPKGYRFEIEELVLLWMAEDLLPESRNESNTMEDVGRMYFYLLHTHSFLQSRGSGETEFVMHDLIHDLAQFFSGEFCLHLEGYVDKSRVYKQCRHISHFRGADDVFAKFEPVTSLKYLRTFLTLSPYLRLEFHYLSGVVLSELPKFKKLRVLSLNGYYSYALPDTIGSLKHLRYLNLSYNLIECLPDAVKNLYNLQTLILQGCQKLTMLHADLGSLTKLRHIDTDGSSLKQMPLRMGNLTCLQSLSHFVIGNDLGSKISQLENLSSLQGKLCISGLQNIKDSKDARDAVLSNKEYLHELILEWSSEDSEKHELEERVFCELKPHVNLKSFEISNFHGSEFPPWMGDSSFRNLVALCIDKCRNCETLPSVGQLPSLKKLVLKELDKVDKIGDDLWGNCDSSRPFPSLQILILEKMKNLCVWTSRGENRIFTCLEELQILDCPKLVNLTYCFPSLKKLQIERCGELTGLWKPYTHASLLNDYKFLCSVHLVGCSKLEDIPRNIFELEMLYLDGCDPKLSEFPESLVDQEVLNLEDSDPGLSKLQKLIVYDSEIKLLWSARQSSLEVLNDSQMESINLRDLRLHSLKLLDLINVRRLDKLPETFIQKCPKLEELKIFYCPDLVSLASEQEEENLGFCYLRCITIKGCEVLKALPVEMVKFAPSIESLYVEKCQSLAKLPSDLSKLNSLQVLTFIKCEQLETFPETGFPTSLKRLTVRECHGMKIIRDQMLRNCSSLEFMEIERCNELVSIGENGDLPSTLKHLKIGTCKSLLSLPQGLSISMNLRVLEISDCNLVTSFPQVESSATSFQTMDLPPALQRLVISDCASLRSLPLSIHKLKYLQNLEISECPLIEHFPNRGLPNSKLKSLTIKCRESLRSLPIEFRNMGSLDELEISGCPSLIYENRLPYNLKKLVIRDCRALHLEPLQLDTLNLLQLLTIHTIPGPVIYTQKNPLPYSITELNLINLPGLFTLPEPLETPEVVVRLPKLRQLYISKCHELKSIPKNGLPSTVSYLRVLDCPLVTASWIRGKGDYWKKISMIPDVEIK